MNQTNSPIKTALHGVWGTPLLVLSLLMSASLFTLLWPLMPFILYFWQKEQHASARKKDKGLWFYLETDHITWFVELTEPNEEGLRGCDIHITGSRLDKPLNLDTERSINLLEVFIANQAVAGVDITSASFVKAVNETVIAIVSYE